MTKLEELVLNRRQLEEVRQALRERITEGLERDGQEIRALLTYLPPPRSAPAGQALVMDCGGTNMRAALVDLLEARVVAGPLEGRIPDGRGQAVSADDFFDAQAGLIAQLKPPPQLPIGYCFSYPTHAMPTRDASLIRWTKGIHVPGVEGELVGAALQRAMSRAGLEPGEVTVLNDTVASLLAGVLSFPHWSEHVGLIVGTGTNMAAFLPTASIPKLPPPPPLGAEDPDTRWP
ncbi:MAG: hexokinase, partial [Candidatus Eremiobacterota bacterium]